MWNVYQSSRCSGTSAGLNTAVIWAHSNDYWSSLELLCSGESLLCLTHCSQGLMGRSRVSVSLEECVTGEYWSEVLCGLQWEWIQSLFSQGRSMRDAAARGTGGDVSLMSPSRLFWHLLTAHLFSVCYRHSCMPNVLALVCIACSPSRARGTVKSSSACFVMQMIFSSCWCNRHCLF